MARKIAALLIVSSMHLMLLPPPAASAAVTGAATLTAGQQVFPGTDRSFTVRAVNNNTPVVGTSVNWVSILLPSQAGMTAKPASQVAAPAGWSVTSTSSGAIQRYVFTATGSGIGPGGAVNFTFPADVARPTSMDLSGEFRVFLSDDRGQTTERAVGVLTTVVRVLEVTSLAPSAPAGVTDGTVTSKQTFDYTAVVKNHAANALDVTTTIGGNFAEALVPGNDGAAPFTVQVTATENLGSQQGQVGNPINQTFVAVAAASGASASRSHTVSVQIAPALLLQTLQPSSVRTAAGASPFQYAFTATARKTSLDDNVNDGNHHATPNLTINACSMSFNGNSFTLANPTTWTSNDTQPLRFAAGPVTGPDGRYAATFNCTGVDDNGKPFGPANVTGNLAVTIDNLGIVISDLRLTRPACSQTSAPSCRSNIDAVKDGDTVGVSFNVDEATAIIQVAEVRTDCGTSMPVTNLTRNNLTYTGSVVLNTGCPTSGNIYAHVEVLDYLDGNPTGADSPQVVLDNVVPALASGRTLDLKTIRVLFDENRVIYGGCDPSDYIVEGQSLGVQEVRYSDGSPCISGQAGPAGAPDNFRVLVLRGQLPTIDSAPTVTYDPSRVVGSPDPVIDGAVNRALRGTVATVVGILPGAPEITRVTRNAGAETATFDDGAFYTRFSGNDLMLTFTGGVAGYTIHVLEGSSTIASYGVGGSSDTIVIPLGNTDGTYNRGIQFQNAAGRGEIARFSVVLDRVVPALSQATVLGTSGGRTNVEVRFSEKLWSGSDFANDWYGYESSPFGPSPYQASSVQRDNNDLAKRVVVFQFNDPSKFAGVDYLFTSGGTATRYVDRAGNPLADTL